jgi:hypothetical protein
MKLGRGISGGCEADGTSGLDAGVADHAGGM